MTAPTTQKEASHRAHELKHRVGVEGYKSKALIGVQTVAELIGDSTSTVWRRAKDGTLPRPIKIGGMTRWSRAEIEAVIAQRLAERDGPEAA